MKREEVSLKTQFLMNTANILQRMQAEIPVKPGSNFNILSILRNESDEVNLHSRFIYELLNPSGSHGMGDKFLREFFRVVLKREYVEGTIVRREVRIDSDDNYGRIDLLIKSKSYCFPIEVKIFAGDQEHQLARYYKYAKDVSKNESEKCVFYLTLNGRKPSEQSITPDYKESSEPRVCCIAFKRDPSMTVDEKFDARCGDICSWIESCCSIAWNVTAIVEVLKQYLKLIDRLVISNEKDPVVNQLEALISESKENFSSALALYKAVADAKEDMMARVLNDIEKGLNEIISAESLESKIELLHWNHEGEARAFYQHFPPNASDSVGRRNWPAIQAILKTNALCNYNIALRIEIDWRLFFGVVFYQKKNGKWIQVPNKANELEGAFEDSRWKTFIKNRAPSNSWWLWWDYLPLSPNSDVDEHLDFVRCNDAYQNLYNSNDYQQTMNRIYDNIKGNLQSIISTGLPKYDPIAK